jgi:hypothetical protein
MEIEEKIIAEISNHIGEVQGLETDILEKINKLIVYQSVMVTEKEKTDRDATNYIENKLYDFIEK